MYATIIIAISCAVSIAFLSKASITININHSYPQPIVDKVDNNHAEVAQQVDDAYDKEELPTFDDVLKMAQEMIGGEYDAD